VTTAVLRAHCVTRSRDSGAAIQQKPQKTDNNL
jgi:hypothetical protein